MQLSFVRAATVALALSLPFAALAQAPAGPAAKPGAEDPVVARVNGAEIKRSEVMATIEGLPAQYQQIPLPVLFNGVLTQLVDRKLMSQAAQAARLKDDAEVKRRMVLAEERVLQEVYLTREMEKGLTDDKIKARYEKMVKEQPPAEEVRARHILVDNEEKATKVIADLKKGGKFEELAKANSSGPSANNGGDLGFFKKEDMVQEFSDAAFALKPGQVTEKPVKSQFGWHVIKVEERRQAAPPALDQVRDDIRRDMAQEVVAQLLEGLRSKAKIEQFDETGKPAPAETKPAGPAAPGQQPPPAKK